jgi:diacylglycerol kinase (ATP)
MDRIMTAFNNSINGLMSVYEQEKSFREDILIFILFFPLALFAENTTIEKVLLISSLFIILMAELINTAIEVIIDRISKETHPLSKMAKDIGSGLVFVSFLNATIIWLVIFLN